MKKKYKHGFLALELIVVASVVLGTGFLLMSSFENSATSLANLQLSALTIGGGAIENPNPTDPTPDVVKVIYDENGYAQVLNIKAADINSWSDFKIEALSSGAGIVIQDYLDKDKTVVVPQLYTNGLPVLSIGASSFSGLTIHTVAIPNGVEHLGESAFSYSSLVYMLIPDSVNSLESFAFYSASKLKKVEFLGDVPLNLGNDIFAECGKIDPMDIVVPAQYLANYQAHAAQFGVAPSVFVTN